MSKMKWYHLENEFRPIQSKNHCIDCIHFANLGVIKSEHDRFICRLCLSSGQGLPSFELNSKEVSRRERVNEG